MKSNVLLITRDYITARIIKKAFEFVEVNFYIILISKSKNLPVCHDESILCIIKDLDERRIAGRILEFEMDFDYVFTNDELLIDKIADISKFLNSMCVQQHTVMSRSKMEMKRLLKSSVTKTPEAYIVRKNDDISNSTIFPCVVKPIDGFASNAVTVVWNEESLNTAVRDVLAYNVLKKTLYRDNSLGCIIEDYIDGKEYSIDIIWNNSRVIDSIICSKVQYDDISCPDYVYFIDPNMDESLKSALLSCASEVGKKYNISYGSTHTEVRVKGEELYVIDQAIRPGGGGLIYFMYDKFYSTKIFYDYAMTMMGKEVCKNNSSFDFGDEYVFMMFYNNRRKGIFYHFEISDLPQNIKIDTVLKKVQAGGLIPDPKLAKEYLFFLFGKIKATSLEDFEDKIKLLDDRITVYYEDEQR